MDSATPFVAKEKAVLQSDPIFTLTDGAHRQGAGSGVATATQARRALRRSLPDVPAARAGVSLRAAAAPQPLATE
jgi:hypothetical protein